LRLIILATFEFDEKRGIIKDKIVGKRCIITCADRMQEMFSRLWDVFESGAAVIIFEMGKAAGKRFITETANEIKSNPQLLIATYVKRFMDAGFGKIEVVDFNSMLESAKVRVWDNFFAEIGHGEKTFCNYVGGLMAGMYEEMMHKTPNIQETKCFGKGDPYCEWQLTTVE
jgi:predicted hydrocarbon binding protein